MAIDDKIERMILSALESMEVSSANPTHINKLIQVNNIERPDFSDELGGIGGAPDSPEGIKKQVELDDTVKEVQLLRTGNVGQIQKMSTAQFANIKAFALNPFAFVTKSLLGKLFKGAGILFLIEIARQVADIILQEFFKPGRIFDTRFREQINKQIVIFLTRKEQQELKQGFGQVITTTIGGLRGPALAGQIGGNFFTPDRITPNFLHPQFVDENPANRNAQNRSLGVNRPGNDRRRSR